MPASLMINIYCTVGPLWLEGFHKGGIQLNSDSTVTSTPMQTRLEGVEQVHLSALGVYVLQMTRAQSLITIQTIFFANFGASCT